MMDVLPSWDGFRRFIVGEKGPDLFVPPRPGTVLPPSDDGEDVP